jgi:hypothetical protein
MKGIMRILPAAAMLWALPAFVVAAPSGVAFDQGVDVSALLKQVKEAVQADATAIAPAYIGSSRYDRDCVVFTFNPDDGPVSDRVYLRSTEWVTECNNYPGPGGGQNCWDRPGYTYHERAQVTLRERQKLYPWEYDKFQVCLQGPWLDIYPVAAAYEYKLVQGGNRDGNFVLAPVKKIAMKPDPAGITAQPLSPNMLLTFKDKWASYYAGEVTVLKIAFKKDVPNWFDPTLVEKEITLPAAEFYQVNLPDYAKEFAEKLQPGKKYYVNYAFKRVGKISKPDLMKVGDTEPVAYQPAALGFGR